MLFATMDYVPVLKNIKEIRTLAVDPNVYLVLTAHGIRLVLKINALILVPVPAV